MMTMTSSNNSKAGTLKKPALFPQTILNVSEKKVIVFPNSINQGFYNGAVVVYRDVETPF